jgi:hypothetical protein
MDRLSTFTSRIWIIATGEYYQYTAFTLITLLVSLFAIIAYAEVPSAFRRYLGGIHPLVMILILYIAGMLIFSILMRDGEFAVFRKGDYKGILTAAALTIPFAIVVTIVDMNWPFPVDMNVPYPHSLFFYPAIGYIVDILFHLLPFGLLYILLGKIFPGTNGGWIIRVCILGAALFEPALQVAYAGSSDYPGIPVFVALHLLLINIVQLILFVKFDFLSMYSFRLVYYLWWHIIWGYARLGILFQ